MKPGTVKSLPVKVCTNSNVKWLHVEAHLNSFFSQRGAEWTDVYFHASSPLPFRYMLYVMGNRRRIIFPALKFNKNITLNKSQDTIELCNFKPLLQCTILSAFYVELSGNRSERNGESLLNALSCQSHSHVLPFPGLSGVQLIRKYWQRRTTLSLILAM
jgi:hypothetical protein